MYAAIAIITFQLVNTKREIFIDVINVFCFGWVIALALESRMMNYNGIQRKSTLQAGRQQNKNRSNHQRRRGTTERDNSGIVLDRWVFRLDGQISEQSFHTNCEDSGTKSAVCKRAQSQDHSQIQFSAGFSAVTACSFASVFSRSSKKENGR
mgnify:CR=1 FL=1